MYSILILFIKLVLCFFVLKIYAWIFSKISKCINYSKLVMNGFSDEDLKNSKKNVEESGKNV